MNVLAGVWCPSRRRSQSGSRRSVVALLRALFLRALSLGAPSLDALSLSVPFLRALSEGAFGRTCRPAELALPARTASDGPSRAMRRTTKPLAGKLRALDVGSQPCAVDDVSVPRSRTDAEQLNESESARADKGSRAAPAALVACAVLQCVVVRGWKSTFSCSGMVSIHSGSTLSCKVQSDGGVEMKDSCISLQA